jgi:hypothetical protein
MLERVKRAERDQPRALSQSHYVLLTRAYQHFNKTLFAGRDGGVLPPVEGTAEAKEAEHVVIFTAARKGNSRGYFSPDRWDLRSGGGNAVHEVNLNPDHFYNRPDDEICSTLVHETVHLWQYVFGKDPPRRTYHNKEWSSKMMAIGLMPSNTGAPGGKTTGAKMSHYIVRGGAFAKAFAQLAATGFKFELESKAYAAKERQPTSKVKVTCPQCGQNAWGKEGLAVRCDDCPDRPRMLSKDELEAWQKQQQKQKAQQQAQGERIKRLVRPQGTIKDTKDPPQRVKRKVA